MNVQVAVLCDAATQDSSKLNILGVFDTIYAPQMPAANICRRQPPIAFSRSNILFLS